MRIIEVYKHQFQDLNEVIAQIKNRNYRFIIYMDDLSFEEFEIEYKYLKAVIEGGLETEAGQYPDLCHLATAVIWYEETFKDKEEPGRASFTQTIPFRRSFPWYTVSV